MHSHIATAVTVEHVFALLW